MAQAAPDVCLMKCVCVCVCALCLCIWLCFRFHFAVEILNFPSLCNLFSPLGNQNEKEREREKKKTGLFKFHSLSEVDRTGFSWWLFVTVDDIMGVSQ